MIGIVIEICGEVAWVGVTALGGCMAVKVVVMVMMMWGEVAGWRG
jgi:hypothetical protein